MKPISAILFLFISFNCFSQEAQDPNQIYTITEQMPEFKGGDAKMREFIQKNIVYPQAEKETNITGTCYVTFVVEKNGKITGIKIIRGVTNGPGCDKEAKRVVSAMPAWKAGKQNGREVRVQFNLPIKFTIR